MHANNVPSVASLVGLLFLLPLLPFGSHAQNLADLPSCAVRSLQPFLSSLPFPHPFPPRPSQFISFLPESKEERTKKLTPSAPLQQTPALSAIGSTGCQSSDFKCLCKDNTFIDNALAGAEKQCPPGDLTSVYSISFFAPSHLLFFKNVQAAPSPRTKKLAQKLFPTTTLTELNVFLRRSHSLRATDLRRRRRQPDHQRYSLPLFFFYSNLQHARNRVVAATVVCDFRLNNDPIATCCCRGVYAESDERGGDVWGAW